LEAWAPKIERVRNLEAQWINARSISVEHAKKRELGKLERTRGLSGRGQVITSSKGTGTSQRRKWSGQGKIESTGRWVAIKA